jgi:hypothetical protein
VPVSFRVVIAWAGTRTVSAATTAATKTAKVTRFIKLLRVVIDCGPHETSRGRFAETRRRYLTLKK